MPPKKNGKKSSKKNKKNESNDDNNTKTEWDDFDIPALEEVVSKLTSDHQSSFQQRIQIQTEYEAMQQSYYEATKQSVSKLELQIRAKEMEMEDMIHDQCVEIQAYQEKQKYIQYDHERNLKNMEDESIHLMQVEESNHESKLSQNEKNELALKMEMKERGIVNIEEVKKIKERLKEQLDEVYHQLNNQIKQLEQDCQEQQKQTSDELSLKCHVELREMTEQNNLHIFEIERRHNEMFRETKDYYENVSNGNKNRIQSLKEELDKINLFISNYDNETKRLEDENENLGGPLSAYRKTVESMKLQTRDKDKDKQASINVKSRMVLVEDRVAQELQEIKELQRKYDMVKVDVDKAKKFISDEASEDDLELLLENKIHPISDSLTSLRFKIEQYVKMTNPSVDIMLTGQNLAMKESFNFQRHDGTISVLEHEINTQIDEVLRSTKFSIMEK